jgi:hypothetical protein
MSRIFKRNAILTDNPYSGQGANAYVNGRYRNYRILTSRPQLRQGAEFPVGDATIPKDSASVGSATGVPEDVVMISPDLSAYSNSTIEVDVRHYKDDVECESIHSKKVSIDVSGDIESKIRGSYSLIDTNIRAGGIVRVKFLFAASLNGVSPETFSISRTAGPTSPTDVSVDYEGSGVYEIETVALDDSSPYTFDILAINTTESVSRTLGPVTFTADDTGPAAATSVTAEAV